MPLYSKDDIPFIHEYDYRYLKEVRQLRNLTLSEFSVYMKTDLCTISKLENQQIHFSVHYESKLKEAIQLLQISQLELLSLKRLIELKQQRGIN